MGVSLLYLCLAFILIVLGFSCQRKTTEQLPVLNSKELLIKVSGALDLNFKDSKVPKDTKIQQNGELIIIPNSGQNLLMMNFKSAVTHKDKQETIQISIAVPIAVSSGIPTPGEYLFYNKNDRHISGNIAYTIAKNDKSKLHAYYHFQFTTLILRIEDSDEDGLVANFLMTACQVAGYKKTFGKGEEIQLADDGRIQIQASFDAPVYNQPKVQNRKLI